MSESNVLKLSILDASELEEVDEKILFENRWSNTVESVVKYNEGYYRYQYESPTNEDGLRDANPGLVALYPVEQVEKVVKVWQEKS